MMIHFHWLSLLRGASESDITDIVAVTTNGTFVHRFAVLAMPEIRLLKKTVKL